MKFKVFRLSFVEGCKFSKEHLLMIPRRDELYSFLLHVIFALCDRLQGLIVAESLPLEAFFLKRMIIHTSNED